jgi:hypothetical protein
MQEQEPPFLGKGLAASSMLQASPSQAGPAMKLHIPVIYTLLPGFLQRLLARFLKFLAPAWKSRYLIQVGGYMYKFTDESSKAPKGSPLPVEELDVYLLDDLRDVDGVDDYTTLSLDDYQGFFCVATLRKRHYYAVKTREDALVWVNTLRQARQDSITRRMGHAGDQPYPYHYFDSMASSLVKSKDRIRANIERSSLREMEMTAMGTGGGGPISRGYHG